MEQNKNKRLDELFNQVKHEPVKVSFTETKEKFIKSNVVVGNASLVNKLIQISNLKIIVMISTLSIIVAGAIFFSNNTAEVKVVEEKTSENIESFITDSSLIIEEHERVVEEYFKKVAALKPQLLENDTNKRKLKKRKNKVIDRTWFLNEKAAIDDNLIETVENYRFPNLGYEEITANNKQKNRIFGKLKKQKKSRVGTKKKRSNDPQGAIGREIWYQPDPYGFVFIPMGTFDKDGKKISVQAFYMKQTEVTNLEYRIFLFDLLIQGRRSEFLKAKPDQKMWVKEYPSAFNEPMVENYFSHPAYDSYPVVGMSREGAEMYCKWFTTELIKVNDGLVNDVRIPTDYEWEWAASGGNEKYPYPWGGPYVRNSEGCYLANFRPMKNNYDADGGFHTVKVNSYNPNGYRLYCMSGNVAEMIYYEEENKLPGTKGGSWTSVGQELQIIDGKDRFKGQITPSVNIGFRPVLSYLGRSRKKPLVGVMGAKAITVVPPGTKKIGHNLFFDEAELSNFAWLEYLSWIEHTSGKLSNEYKKALPDTTIWNTELNTNEPYVAFYLRHPAYRNYPVVGISYEQAVAYCKWRTDRVKERFEVLKQKDKKGIYPKNFEYRLPTEEEWESFAKVGYSLKTLKKLESKYEGKIRYNFKTEKDGNMGVAGELNNNADITAPILSYWPNKYGIYNLIGNVAEMTATKGIAKGGAWVHTEKEVGVEKDFKYTGANKWLGFRCVFEVKD